MGITNYVIPLLVFDFHFNTSFDITAAVRVVWFWVGGAVFIPSKVTRAFKFVVVPNVHRLLALVI